MPWLINGWQNPFKNISVNFFCKGKVFCSDLCDFGEEFYKNPFFPLKMARKIKAFDDKMENVLSRAVLLPNTAVLSRVILCLQVSGLARL